jgi:hypothetical protein
MLDEKYISIDKIPKTVPFEDAYRYFYTNLSYKNNKDLKKLKTSNNY